MPWIGALTPNTQANTGSTHTQANTGTTHTEANT